MSSSIFNTTNGPLLIDRAGRVLGAHESRDDVDVSSSPIAGHIAAGRLIVNDDSTKSKPRTKRDTTTPQEG